MKFWSKNLKLVVVYLYTIWQLGSKKNGNSKKKVFLGHPIHHKWNFSVFSSLSEVQSFTWNTEFIFVFVFLSDPSPIIVHPCHQLTDWLTDSLLFSRIDFCYPCEDANSILVEVVLFCWCWCWETCWRKFGADLEAEVWSQSYFLFRVSA